MKNKEYKKVTINTKRISIPSDWQVITVKECCKYVAGSTFPKKEQGNKNGEIPFYKVSDMNSFHKFMGEANNYVSKDKAEELNLNICDKGTLIFPKLGQALLTNKRRMLSEPSAFDNNIAALEADKINHKFLFYYFLRLDFESFCNSSTVPSLNKKTINSIEIPSPSKKEQEKIAEVLSTVDQAIEKTDNIIEESKMAKKGLMQDLLTKGIGHSDFKEVELGPKTLEIPKDWDLKPLDSLTKNKGQYGANESAQDFNEDGYRYIRITDIDEDGKLKNGSKKSIPKEDNEKYELEKNDLLFARTGAPGLTYLHKQNSDNYAFAGYLIKFRPNDKINPDYLFYYTHSYFYDAWINSMTRSTTLGNINAAEYRSLPVITPPLPEQKEIAEILSSIDEKIKKEKEYKQKLKSLKKALMQDLLTGKVRVNNLINS